MEGSCVLQGFRAALFVCTLDTPQQLLSTRRIDFADTLADERERDQHMYRRDQDRGWQQYGIGFTNPSSRALDQVFFDFAGP